MQFQRRLVDSGICYKLNVMHVTENFRFQMAADQSISLPPIRGTKRLVGIWR